MNKHLKAGTLTKMDWCKYFSPPQDEDEEEEDLEEDYFLKHRELYE